MALLARARSLVRRRPEVVRGSLALLMAGYLCAVIQIPLHLDAAAFGQGFESVSIARKLAASSQFADPFGSRTGPTAHSAPVYPFFLALIFRMLGESTAALVILIGLNALLLGLAAALLPVLSWRMFGSALPGTIGGAALALGIRIAPQGESALAEFLLVAGALAIVYAGPAAAGLWAGAATLTNPLALPMLGVFALFRSRRFAAIAAGFALLVCSPWIVRNAVVLGAPYFIRDNLGLELFIANQDDARPELVANTRLWLLHPNFNHDEAALVASIGEGAYNRLRMSQALAWIRSHPASFVRLTLVRAAEYWFPPANAGWPAYPYRAISALGFAGAWLARKNRAAIALACAALIYSLPYAVVQSSVRYGFPALWAAALFAGYALFTARSALRDPRHSSPDHPLE